MPPAPAPSAATPTAAPAAPAGPRLHPQKALQLTGRHVPSDLQRPGGGLQLDVAGRPKVDKYFGSKLPPVCRQLGCYVTDDGKFFFCINPHCHKDKKRETKYNRRRKSLVYFFCPKCKSREIQLHLKKNQYECLECAYSWRQ